ncbi:NADH-quinone oxidoreductase subunit A [Geobacter sp. DSM 9736]|uniref:NADH-quinone oxidoreductase subunit A n=1 Tax=Geobacter sp. DSM 9736 TaxID=1277350 RepID=UPI000B50F0C4|nr:NADH-quinone oxidoreductase subunit A [Geobacter sp. DSM 9736]SNB46932.1 NADH dehydrogenase subunit A [Geobacter sp. DSM 9736]
MERADLLALVIYTGIGTGLIGFLLLAAWWLGSGARSPEKEAAYESGMIPTGNARLAYPVPFYLVAIFFIVFDVEAVFIFTWAVAWDELGLPGMVHITIFIVVLLLGLVWLWIKGGLDWGPTISNRRNSEKRPRQGYSE